MPCSPGRLLCRATLGRLSVARIVTDQLKIVVIPTYNECDNVGALTECIMKLPGDFQVLIVDDNSPDGTGDIADQLSVRFPRVSVLHRTRLRGLGRSYVDGMKMALDRGADLVLQMDADFSHDPRFLPALVAGTADSDLVIGSRYCPRGGIEGWAWHRRILSRGANAYVRSVVGLRSRDNTGAFRCWRSEALARLALDSILSDGYSFLVETAHAAHCLGLRIAEVPITFVERREDQSKLSKRVFLESIVMPWRLVFASNKSRYVAREARP